MANAEKDRLIGLVHSAYSTIVSANPRDEPDIRKLANSILRLINKEEYFNALRELDRSLKYPEFSRFSEDESLIVLRAELNEINERELAHENVANLHEVNLNAMKAPVGDPVPTAKNNDLSILPRKGQGGGARRSRRRRAHHKGRKSICRKRASRRR